MKKFLLPYVGALCFVAAPLAACAAQANPPAAEHVLLKTSLGNIEIALYPKEAPATVKNFLTYVRSGQYNGTIFHRVIPGFMIQGGGYTTDLKEKPTRPPIALESQNGLKNTAGSVAMARTSDPNSATAQFFIDTVDNVNLDYPRPDGHGYAVFGKVVKGMDVVQKIEAVPTSQSGDMGDVPRRPVIIQSATVVNP